MTAFDGHTRNCATSLALLFPDNAGVATIFREFQQLSRAARVAIARDADVAGMAAAFAERFGCARLEPKSPLRSWGVVTIEGRACFVAFDGLTHWVYGCGGLCSVPHPQIVALWELP